MNILPPAIKKLRPSFWKIGSAVVIAGLAAAFFSVDTPVIEIGEFRQCIAVKTGDSMTHTFIHSMYDVPVFERFRIENDGLHLFQVDSESLAALEYYGIENRLENNVNRRIQEFRIPADSIGSHVLIIGNRQISLSGLKDGGRSIPVRIARRPALVNAIDFQKIHFARQQGGNRPFSAIPDR